MYGCPADMNAGENLTKLRGNRLISQMGLGIVNRSVRDDCPLVSGIIE